MAKKQTFAEKIVVYERNYNYGWKNQREIAASMPAGFSVRTWQDWVTGRREPPAWVQVLVIEHLERTLKRN